MSCECKLVVNELLCFIQNKSVVMDELSLVQICISWYNEEEIENAKTYLCEISGLRKIIRKGDKKSASNVSDILKIIKETDDLPKFVASDLNRLPPVTFDHLDISSLLKTLATIKNEMQTFKDETKRVVNKLEGEITEIKEKTEKSSTSADNRNPLVSNLPSVSCSSAGQLGFRNISLADSERPFTPVNQNKGLNFSKAVMNHKTPDATSSSVTIGDNVDEEGFTQVSRKRKRLCIGNYTETNHRSRNPSKNKRGTNTKSTSLKAVEQTIPIYISRFSNDCTETDIQNYFTENGRNTYGIETLNQKRTTNFKSFKVLVLKKDLDTVLKEDFWPESIVFRTYKQSQRENVVAVERSHK